MLATVMLTTSIAQGQSFEDDFENGYTWYPPWQNIVIATDSSEYVNHYCRCDTTMEYGLGFDWRLPDSLNRKNLHLTFHADYRFPDTVASGQLVVTIEQQGRMRYWTSHLLSNFANENAQWFPVNITMNLPADYTDNGDLKLFFWNEAKTTVHIDNAELNITPYKIPTYQPIIEHENDSATPLLDLSSSLLPVVEYINANGDTVSDPSVIETNFHDGRIETRFKEDLKLLRLAYILPLPDGKLTVYRRNQHIDTTFFQHSYYLDREGLSIENDSLCFSTYHNTEISSLQLDLDERTLIVNIDYWRDHPLLHFPLRSDTSDMFQDISYREIKKNEVLSGKLNLYETVMEDMPRIMPVWDGYLSAFIFTEHADWTDLRTHRAVLFGNEHITKPAEAVGGFCFFNIPVTKSVFYWNPDNVTNEETSGGRINNLVASIKTDKEFYKMLKDIKKEGFEICLHTPEVYTTLPEGFPQAMRFMRRKFNTKSWIDHGYNNGADKNREDMICDGLLPDSPYYAADLWRKNGVRYLWNAYYEENRMEDRLFDGHFVQPYDGFGDALPNRQISPLPNGDKDFLLWSTPSTLEVNEDREWYYYFDSIRLQRLVDQHNVFITHVYPAWSNPWRAFWQYNENNTAVAMPGFNFALSQLAHFRDQKKILPTTIEQYLSYYEKLLNIDYQILTEKSIQLTNRGEAIDGLTLLCTKPIVVVGKTMDFRKVSEGYLVWFNLGKNETVLIRYRE